MTSLLGNIAGFLGAGAILAGYSWQTIRQAPPDLIALCLNLAGAILLGLSLLVHYNLPSLLLEIAWAAIAIIGIVGVLRRRAAGPAE